MSMIEGAYIAGKMLERAIELKESDDNDVVLLQLTKSQVYVLGACQAYFSKALEGVDHIAHHIGEPEMYDDWYEAMKDFAEIVDKQLEAQKIFDGGTT